MLAHTPLRDGSSLLVFFEGMLACPGSTYMRGGRRQGGRACLDYGRRLCLALSLFLFFSSSCLPSSASCIK